MVEFSRTGKLVLPLGLGTHGLGHAFGSVDGDVAEKIFTRLKEAVSSTANVIVDVAPRYGHGDVEERLGRFMSGNSTPFLIATKGGRHITQEKDNQKEWTREFLRQDIENSLSRLGVDKVFLYQLHNPDLNTITDGRVFQYLESFRSEGLIDWYGLSINYPEEGISAIETCDKLGLEGLVSIQAIYSALNKNGFEQLSHAASSANVAIIAREVMVRGFLSGKYLGKTDYKNAPSAIEKLVKIYGVHQLTELVKAYKELVVFEGLPPAQTSIAFSLTNPSISVTLAGISKVKYFEEDWGAIGLSLPTDILGKINSLDDLVPI